MMELEAIYDSDEDCTDAPAQQKWSRMENEGTAKKSKGRVYLVWMTVSLGLICVLLLVFIIWLNISLTAERDLLKRYETTVQEFNHTINSLQTNYTDLTTEKDQLKKSLSSLSQKNQELNRNVTSLNEELKNTIEKGDLCGLNNVFMSDKASNWSEIRQYCRDRGADLIMIKTEEKQRIITRFVKERVWIGLSDMETESNLTWVDNSPLTKGFWRPGEPNDEHGIEDCVEIMANGLSSRLNNWNDLPCSLKRRGICEK